ncbi:uncharacterized protein RCC_07439 [Ramularia collo-cygni]|uniref:DNA topoisomerase (ATP-hydrolyzing) n=1 Tax=Ramularia collo-cygni TaxID=112498 RepID=A0A2D3V4G8_9PEZI|nr:uncharacterized protein RCC_07439 [Ramularia collo-cygni]CZT21575.1 uncharacterized protein RCC_07439 [Ramularia collo-cygni]
MDDDFEELLCENELLHGSSQGSLTDAAANLSCVENGGEDVIYTSQNVYDSAHDQNMVPRALSSELTAAAVSDLAVCDPIQRTHPNADVIDRIENVFEQIADAMLNERKQISITLKTRLRASTDIRPDEDRMKRLSFPGKSADEAWRFAVVIRILELMHEALRNDVVMSKRDPALFGSQTHVDRYVDDIAFTFGVTRTALNVTAVAKGLVAGAVTFCRRDGSTFTAAGDQDGVLVPALKDILSVDMSTVRWVLVIEKEATFRSIAASSFWEHIATEGVIITGKGYPDLASRALLQFLGTASPRNGFASPPVYGLADFDPDGVAIMSTYKHGSKALAHENKSHSVPQLQWLGLRSKSLLLDANDSHVTQEIMMLTARDRRKALQTIQYGGIAGNRVDGELVAELKRMLMLNMKAELQLLDAVPGAMMRLLHTLCNTANV